jgi:hypothetical protein
MAEFSHVVGRALALVSGPLIQKTVPQSLFPLPEREANLMPQVPGGLAVSIVGIINGAINAIGPQVLVFLRSLGVPV